MPIGFSSPARNLFLLGGSGEGIVTNFFRAIARNNNESTIQVTSNQYVDTTKTFYTGGDNRYLSSAPVGSANRRYGFVEERDIEHQKNHRDVRERRRRRRVEDGSYST